MFNDSYLRKGIIYSLALHAFVFIVALFFKVNLLPSSASSDMQVWEFDLSDEISLPQGYYSDKQKITQEEQKFSNADTEEDFSAKTLTNLADDLSIDDLVKSRNRFDKSDLFNRNTEEVPEVHRMEMREPSPSTEVKSKYLEKFVDSVNSNRRDNSPFLLEGDVLLRQILTKKIPEYPKNNRQNAKVILEFEVLPDGSVKNIIVLKKASPEMETLSVQALKQWRFNPIGTDKSVKGKMTFIYQVN
ncbi:MAG: TonB family protein [Candidatus Cloacimonetes bacterium]|nr:TonB family protein [Candidatus Cloacimonadota bacterium]